MFEPTDPLAPPRDVFHEAWQAQVLAIADAMVQAGHFSADEWAQALGAELRAATQAPDTLDTYYSCALNALERLTAAKTSIDFGAQQKRKTAWRTAYLSTPHGDPVKLGASDEVTEIP